jgi:hypothetical protein
MFLAILTASAVGGCETKFTVNHYPDFYKPSIRSVAVLPFENATNRKGAGEIAATHLSVALATNGTYKVTGPAQLEQTLKEKEMPALNQNDYKNSRLFRAGKVALYKYFGQRPGIHVCRSLPAGRGGYESVQAHYYPAE